jgi:hypothetical protein
MEKIEIDADVYTFLRSRVRNFNETPNSVLRRELGLDVAREPRAKEPIDQVAKGIPVTAPAALVQVVEVVSMVRRDGMDRVTATLRLAERLGVARETVSDKYGRQLGLSTQEFDALVNENHLSGLIELLVNKFPRYESSISDALKDLTSW